MLEQIREILLLHNGKKSDYIGKQKLRKVLVSLKMIHMLKPERSNVRKNMNCLRLRI